MTRFKIASALVTLILGALSVAVGAGVPLSPSRIAASTEAAADNAAVAERNTRRTVDATRALQRIAQNVDAQLQASRDLLRTQLDIEETSRRSARQAGVLAERVTEIRRTLARVARRLEDLARLSSRSAITAERSAGSGDRLASTLRTLRATFDAVVRESRELNRKARGYERVQP